MVKEFAAFCFNGKKGEKKILDACKLPLTGVKCVNRIITDYCVLDVTDRGLELLELAPGATVEQVQSMTEPTLIVDRSKIKASA